MLKFVDNTFVCRVCSGRGEHEISFPIPFYLHETPNEVRLWRKPIRILLEEILHIPVRPDDGLPQRMCTVCISYMKHAITFRNQALACRLRLLPTKLLCHKVGAEVETKGSSLGVGSTSQLPMNLEDRNDNRKMGSNVNKLQNKVKFQDTSIIPDITHVGGNSRGFFSYQQKAFVEDDVTEMPFFDGENFTANPPEKLSERKCRYCRMRFMFEETYDEHTSVCIHRRFAIFINQCNQVYEMKIEGTITPHEFIRRMVFLLQTNQDILDRLQACEKKITQRDERLEGLNNEGVQSPEERQSPDELQSPDDRQSPEELQSPDECQSPNELQFSEEEFLVNDIEDDQRSPSVEILEEIIVNLEEKSSTGTESPESSPEPPDEPIELKKVICSTCGSGFLTISHLDIHRIHCSK
ncbi:uncharacterized protein LOC129795939 [Lutzomyia longipalpis]|uniref:uncharacterized protein LOC129795939 n=1 Tax=Lutzomyia longipalpis TaxID=7200 RepID=UPI0024846191|nr:uncharacterized protein LOC129795939 [Lutzomyia longipalpis]XP_055693480.1 uncharacterized protein LOC129795939 [Lutzomyia longipalpis]